MSPQQAAAIEPEKIRAFFTSALYRGLMAEHSVRREFKFSVLVPAARYFPVAADAPEEKVQMCIRDRPRFRGGRA